MRIIEIKPTIDGSHRVEIVEELTEIPQGWALIPEGMFLPNTFPYVDIFVSNGMVTKITPSRIPASTEMEKIRADVDYIAIMTGVDL